MMMGSNVVLGITGDFAFSSLHSSSPSNFTNAPFYSCGVSCDLDVNWFATARARLGYAMGNTMPYITGGAAAAGLDAYFPGFAAARGRKARVGWTAGAGIEHAFSSNVTGRIEYLYTDLGRLNITGACNTRCFTDVKFSIVRAGLDFHF